MSSPGQKRGACGHAMASFDGHLSCARCRDKGKGKDTCVENKDSTNCSHCNVLTPEQKAQLATPSYKLKKEKREAKKAETETPMESNTLVDPSSVSVLGVVDNAGVVSPSVPPEKKVKKDKDKVVVKTKKSTSSAESKIADLDLKWSERFNRLEALLLSKSLQPSFSADVRVSPSHTPPANISKDSESFFQPSVSSVDHSNVERTGPDNTDASQHQSAGKLQNTPPAQRTGPDTQLATKQQSAGKLSDKPSRVDHSSKRTGPDNKDASQQQSAGKLPVQTSGRTGPDKMSSKQGFTGKSLSERPVTNQPSDRPVDRLQSSVYTGPPDETVSPVWNLLQTVIYRIDHPLNCLWKMQNYQITRRLNRTRTFQRIRPTVKQCGGYVHTWDGPTCRTLIVQTPLMIIPLPAPRLLHLVRFQFRCRQRIGYVENWPNST